MRTLYEAAGRRAPPQASSSVTAFDGFVHQPGRPRVRRYRAAGLEKRRVDLPFGDGNRWIEVARSL
jgi:hypothetical protein